jgi:hypothetical protein
LWRIFNAAEFRAYWSNSGPPVPGSTPQATGPSLPFVTAGLADGTWWFSLSWFNGVFDSQFLPIGPNGETFLRLDLAGGHVTGSPPAGPTSCQLQNVAGGIVRIIGLATAAATMQFPESWAIAWTADGSTPAAGAASIFIPFTAGQWLGLLDYVLPAQAAGATVKVCLQTAINTGTALAPVWVYSESSILQSIVLPTSGPSPPLEATDWPGELPSP